MSILSYIRRSGYPPPLKSGTGWTGERWLNCCTLYILLYFFYFFFYLKFSHRPTWNINCSFGPWTLTISWNLGICDTSMLLPISFKQYKRWDWLHSTRKHNLQTILGFLLPWNNSLLMISCGHSRHEKEQIWPSNPPLFSVQWLTKGCFVCVQITGINGGEGVGGGWGGEGVPPPPGLSSKNY